MLTMQAPSEKNAAKCRPGDHDRNPDQAMINGERKAEAAQEVDPRQKCQDDDDCLGSVGPGRGGNTCRRA